MYGWRLGLDEIFLRGLRGSVPDTFGRGSPQSSANFILLGLSMLIFELRFLKPIWAQVSTLLVGANAMVAATAYLFTTQQFYGFPYYESAMGMAIGAAAGFMFLTGALLASRPRVGLMSLVVSNTRAGVMALRILVASIFVPPIVAAVTNLGVTLGWYDIRTHISAFAILIMAIILKTTWGAARQAEKEELRVRSLEEALRLSEAKAWGIITISADAIVGLDKEKRITLFNEGAARMFGYTKEEVLGKPLEMMVPPEYRQMYRDNLDSFLKGTERTRRMGLREVPAVAHRRNGERFPVDTALSKFRIDGGQVVTIAIRDITEQKRVENEQRFLAEVGTILASTLDYEVTLENIARSGEGGPVCKPHAKAIGH
jgi:PAS domain S-box-containing protein